MTAPRTATTRSLTAQNDRRGQFARLAIQPLRLASGCIVSSSSRQVSRGRPDRRRRLSGPFIASQKPPAARASPKNARSKSYRPGGRLATREAYFGDMLRDTPRRGARTRILRLDASRRGQHAPLLPQMSEWVEGGDLTRSSSSESQSRGRNRKRAARDRPSDRFA